MSPVEQQLDSNQILAESRRLMRQSGSIMDGLEEEDVKREARDEREDLIDTEALSSRKIERTKGKEEAKTRSFQDICDLIDAHEADPEGTVESVHKFLHDKRVDQHYGTGWIGRQNARLAGADLIEGPTARDDRRLRTRKVLIKSLISLGIGGALVATMGGSGVVMAAGVVGGAVGRGIVEGYRYFRGTERRDKQELEKAEKASARKITGLVDDLIQMRIDKEGENPDGIEADPEYQKRFLEIVTLTHDSSKRRVEIVAGPDNQIDYEGLGLYEEPKGDKISSIGLAQAEIRKREKGAERISDLFALVGSLSGAIAGKVLQGAHAIASNAAHIKEALANEGIVRDLNGDKIPHKIVLAINEHAGKVTEKLYYVKDAISDHVSKFVTNSAGQVVANPDMYISGTKDVAGDLVLENGQHWHAVGQSLSAFIDKVNALDAARLSIEGIKGVVAAGGAALAQFIAGLRGGGSAEMDKLAYQAQMVDKILRGYQYKLGEVSGGGSGGGDSDSGDNTQRSQVQTAEGGAQVPVEVSAEQSEEEEAEEGEAEAEVEAEPKETPPEKPKGAPSDQDIEKSKIFWSSVNQNEKEDYRQSLADYIRGSAGSGKIAISLMNHNSRTLLPKGDQECKLAAVKVMAYEEGYWIGDFDLMNNGKDAEAEIKPLDQAKDEPGGEPADPAKGGPKKKDRTKKDKKGTGGDPADIKEPTIDIPEPEPFDLMAFKDQVETGKFFNEGAEWMVTGGLVNIKIGALKPMEVDLGSQFKDRIFRIKQVEPGVGSSDTTLIFQIYDSTGTSLIFDDVAINSLDAVEVLLPSEAADAGPEHYEEIREIIRQNYLLSLTTGREKKPETEEEIFNAHPKDISEFKQMLGKLKDFNTQDLDRDQVDQALDSIDLLSIMDDPNFNPEDYGERIDRAITSLGIPSTAISSNSPKTWLHDSYNLTVRWRIEKKLEKYGFEFTSPDEWNKDFDWNKTGSTYNVSLTAPMDPSVCHKVQSVMTPIVKRNGEQLWPAEIAMGYPQVLDTDFGSFDKMELEQCLSQLGISGFNPKEHLGIFAKLSGQIETVAEKVITQSLRVDDANELSRIQAEIQAAGVKLPVITYVDAGKWSKFIESVIAKSKETEKKPPVETGKNGELEPAPGGIILKDDEGTQLIVKPGDTWTIELESSILKQKYVIQKIDKTKTFSTIKIKFKGVRKPVDGDKHFWMKIFWDSEEYMSKRKTKES